MVGAEKKRRGTGGVFYASLFGVGAPEALVIGVVALLVFGPKGLAEVSCETIMYICVWIIFGLMFVRYVYHVL